MRHVMLSRYLLASVCFAAADDARAKAQEAKKAQEAEEAKKAAEADRAAQQRQDSDGGPAGPDGEKPPADAVAAGQAPPVDPENIDVKSLLSRLDAQDRLIATLTAQMAGGAGPAPDAAKDVTAVSPGAAFDPRLTRPLPPGVSSAPATQPIPSSAGAMSTVAPTDARAMWGNTPEGAPVKPRAYPALEDEDVVVIAAGYYDDSIRNAGDVIRGYTGPAGSWFVPKSLYEKVGPEAAYKEWTASLARYAEKKRAA